MNIRQSIRRFASDERVNFVLTNHLGRNAWTLLIGRFSKIESPWLAGWSIRVWRLFTDLDLSDSRSRHFTSLHACFTRELVPNARPQDMRAHIVTSPSDGIVGAMGTIAQGTALQAKGMTYPLEELLQSKGDAQQFEGGTYITLRLTSAMYHRFHAPHDVAIDRVVYVRGDTWNVNPPALARVSRLFCRNERAVIHARLLQSNLPIALVPVAAVLVASIRLHFIDVLLHLRYRGARRIWCDHACPKGAELGWFEHGSTIVVLVPKGSKPVEGLQTGARVRVGQALVELVAQADESGRRGDR
jgi:phosphatidylserine decarboxylase